MFNKPKILANLIINIHIRAIKYLIHNAKIIFIILK